MEIIVILFRTFFFYFFVVFMYRLMGKREVGQLGVNDLIVSILISEMMAIAIENPDSPMINTIFPILLLVLLEISLAYISIKSRTIRTILTGKPAMIINHGKLNYKEMINQRYSIDDLLLQIRQSGLKSIEDVEYAILENNGRLSIYKYNIFKTNTSYPSPIILDGKIQFATLKQINKSFSWFDNYLKQNNLKVEDIFYAFYKKNKLYIIKNNKSIAF